MRTTQVVFLFACASMGCSLVNDPNAHVGGARDAAVSPDAATSIDAALPSDGGPPPLPMEELCMSFGIAFCDALPHCCSTTTEVPGGCAAAAQGQCEALLAAALTDRRIDYDPIAAASSLEHGRELAERCATTELLDWLTARRGLFAAFNGSVTGGNSCEPIGTSLAELAVAFLVCEDGAQTCRGTDGSRTCQARAAVGMPCTYRLECQDNLRCVRPIDVIGAPGTCAAAGEPVGSTCGLDDECQDLNCTAEGFLALGVCAATDQDSVYCPG